MADRVLFIGWTGVIPGREKQAAELATKATEYFNKLQADGKIESFETVILRPHGGDLNGFRLIKGEAEKLDAVKREETFRIQAIEANYCYQGYGIVDGIIGEGVTWIMSRYQELVGA
ncbi:MAG: hypothetical protein JRI34_08855 [Deltaproteobacteria bacterium]|nr:hypothetical protein [Deltaproteobacteria bacterium]